MATTSNKKTFKTSGNRTPGSRSYSDILDALADSVCIHLLVLNRRSKRKAARSN